MKDKNIETNEIDQNIENCGCNHKDIAERIKGDMPKDEIIFDLADLFKALSDSTRIKIIFALFKEEMCVYAIADTLNMTQSAISHQLRVLKQARLVKFRKEGKTVYYSLNDEHISQIFNCGLDHVNEKYNH